MIKLVNNRIGGICTWAVEGADAEVAAGEYVAKRCVTDIVVGRESGKQGELH